MGSLPCWTSRKQETKRAKKGTTLHTKGTPTQVDSLKKTLQSQNSYEVHTRGRQAGHNKEMDKYS